MARPRKNGLDYFPLDTDFLYDDKIFELTNQRGPLGQMVYLSLLSEVYREGYYIDIPLDRLANMIIRSIGSRWISSREEVIEILDLCALIGLLDKELYAQGIITSKGIQRRYSEITVRRKQSNRLYWLIGEHEQTGEAAENEDTVDKIDIFDDDETVCAEETPVNVCDNATNKSKENKTKSNQSVVNQNQSISGASADACGSGAAGNDEMMIRRVFEEFELIKPPTETERVTLSRWCGWHGAVVVLAAVRETNKRGGKSLAYVEKVLATMVSGEEHDRVEPGPWTREMPRSHSGFYTEELISEIMDDF